MKRFQNFPVLFFCCCSFVGIKVVAVNWSFRLSAKAESSFYYGKELHFWRNQRHCIGHTTTVSPSPCYANGKLPRETPFAVWQQSDARKWRQGMLRSILIIAEYQLFSDWDSAGPATENRQWKIKWEKLSALLKKWLTIWQVSRYPDLIPLSGLSFCIKN